MGNSACAGSSPPSAPGKRARIRRNRSAEDADAGSRGLCAHPTEARGCVAARARSTHRRLQTVPERTRVLAPAASVRVLKAIAANALSLSVETLLAQSGLLDAVAPSQAADDEHDPPGGQRGGGQPGASLVAGRIVYVIGRLRRRNRV